MDEYLWVLKDVELDLVREVEAMAGLDEDALLDLHKRVRRARTKHVTNYRRKAAGKVAKAGGRGAAAPAGAKSRLRAEAFEELLSQVSGRLAVVAHEQAEALKRDRLAQARAGRSSGPATDGAAPATGEGRTPTHTKTSGGRKRDASSAAQGARRQARRDAR